MSVSREGLEAKLSTETAVIVVRKVETCYVVIAVQQRFTCNARYASDGHVYIGDSELDFTKTFAVLKIRFHDRSESLFMGMILLHCRPPHCAIVASLKLVTIQWMPGFGATVSKQFTVNWTKR